MNTVVPERDDAETDVERFFADFDAAFVSFDGAVIAERYAEPYLACRADGTAEVMAQHPETAQYFQRIVDDYYNLGIRSCSHRDIDVSDVGARHVVGTVTWDLSDAAGTTVISWRESYVLVDIEGLLVRSSIDHPADG